MVESRSKRAFLSHKFSCTRLAIGDGHGCRQVELFFSLLNSVDFFRNKLQYSVVGEEGSSIYSVSEAAKADNPGLDPLFISAGRFITSCWYDIIYLAT